MVKKKTVRTAIGTKKTIKVDKDKNLKLLAVISIDAAQCVRAYQNNEVSRAKRQQKSIITRLSKLRL